MDFTRMRALESLFSMIHQGVRNVLQYNQQHPDFPMEVSKPVICTFSGNSDMPEIFHVFLSQLYKLRL